mgnify:CR=1 FL=1
MPHFALGAYGLFSDQLSQVIDLGRKGRERLGRRACHLMKICLCDDFCQVVNNQ